MSSQTIVFNHTIFEGAGHAGISTWLQCWGQWACQWQHKALLNNNDDDDDCYYDNIIIIIIIIIIIKSQLASSLQKFL